ncbi:hypothetical protein FJ251_06305 [bacterium]|nr:hypothetical protein [bacterium]
MAASGRRFLALLVALSALAGGFALLSLTPGAACARGLSAAEEAAAEREHAEILAAFERGEAERARARGAALLERSPDWRGAPALARRLAESDLEEARWALALEQLSRLLERYPASPERWPAIVLKARALAASGRSLDAAVGLDRALETWQDEAWRPRAEALLADLLDHELGAADLQRFLDRRPTSRRLGQAQKALARAQAAPRPGATPAATPAGSGPAAPAAAAAAAPAPAPPASVRGGRVGLLAPLTGRYQIYGEALRDGARLALGRFNSQRGADFALVEADTEGEPVKAALAARRLIQVEQVSALLGEVLSNPTVAAAVEANARGVPLLSPAATAEDIHAVGEWVFQNRISGEAQALALGRVAVRELLGARFAVLYPKQGDGETLARLFASTVEGLGGELVASVAYDVGATDFGEVLEELRVAQPELLFLPGEVEQLILLVPQLAFYGIDAQLLGNEAWNSRRLARQGGAGIEGAVFPSDLLLLRDRELLRDFERLHAERFESGVRPIAARGFLGLTLLLESLLEGGGQPAATRALLAERTAAAADEATRRAALAAQVTLMTVHGGEIQPFQAGPPWRPAVSGGGFIDGP